MKVLMVLASFGMLVAAAPQYSSSQYGAPGPVQGGGNSGGYGAPQQQQQQGGYQSGPQEQRIHKHVYVHVAPEEPEAPRYRAPKAPQVPEKHYKILFIRAPEEKYEQPDIPELPPAPEQKTLVYVLLKKPDATQAISIPTPAPTKPSKPEVYFIRYKSPEGPNNAYGAPQQGGSPIGPAPSGQYGSPAQASPAGQYGAPGGQY